MGKVKSMLPVIRLKPNVLYNDLWKVLSSDSKIETKKVKVFLGWQPTKF